MIGFITCGKSKRPERCKAKDLYNSPLSKNKQLYLKVLYPDIDIYIVSKTWVTKFRQCNRPLRHRITS